MDDDIWRLPGPARLIAETVREVTRGRHAAVVLPVVLGDDQDFVAGLTGALSSALWAANELPQWVTTDGEDSGPLLWLAQALNVGDGPLSTARILDDPEAAGRTAVLDCTGLHPKHRQEVSAIVTRLVAESRPRRAEDRPRVLLICTRDTLPQLGTDYADVTFEPLWWWGRLNRWDVAARIQPAIEARSAPGVLRDVRLETLIEVCRWDIRLAAHLADCWDGDPHSLPILIDEATSPSAVKRPPAGLPRNSGRRPSGEMADYWDAGTVDLWHDECVAAVRAATTKAEVVRHAVWAAQARVLLPWIETRRQLVAASLLRTHGKATVQAVLDGGSDVLEVGPLFVAVNNLSGRARPALRDAVYLLRQARNKLAHLQALTTNEQRDLVAAFAKLNLQSGQ
ncbi:hypothetical protein [Micromonospora sp. RTGN7]|uniref:hypothetical protein n=1 Tax=Micromonospora sp. RTGN7 TaxID=3016526 RepID=UPI0029FED456|nr:hypothetical protein [Micromonospora sp. RTGN7]